MSETAGETRGELRGETTDKTKVDGGDLLVQTLRSAGVDVAFVLHGGHLDPIFQACMDQGIRLVDTRHEAAAGHAADAYARQTGTVAVAMATAGPGFTNILTAITQAHLDGSPILFIIGAAPLRDAEQWPLQGGLDQVAMAKPVTKWAAQATSTELIPHLVAQALRTARAGRPGPVLLEVPIDVLYRRVEQCPIPNFPEVYAPAPAPAAVKEVLEMLQQAQRPVIVAGGGCLFSQASRALIAFAETTGIPVFTNGKAHGVFPNDHKLSGRGLGNIAALAGTPSGGPDAALFLGARFGMFTGGGRLLPEDCKLAQVDIDAGEMGRLRAVDIPIEADCQAMLSALNNAADVHQWPDRSPWAQTIRALACWHETAFTNAGQADHAPAHPYLALQEVFSTIDSDTIVCADGGEASQWAELAAPANHPAQFMGHGYLGCLGIGMPFAIGAQIANPDRRVICVVGDGAVGLNIQEFDTMVRHNLPIVTIVLNNKAWGMCVHGQAAMFGGNRLVVTELGESRYDLVAEGFGCYGAFAERPDQVREAVAAALASGRPACVNILTDLDIVFGPPGKSAKPADSEVVDDGSGEIEMPYYDNLKENLKD
jgi:acetolactate synthase-1/2/3 large subunit